MQPVKILVIEDAVQLPLDNYEYAPKPSSNVVGCDSPTIDILETDIPVHKHVIPFKKRKLLSAIRAELVLDVSTRGVQKLDYSKVSTSIAGDTQASVPTSSRIKANRPASPTGSIHKCASSVKKTSRSSGKRTHST